MGRTEVPAREMSGLYFLRKRRCQGTEDLFQLRRLFILRSANVLGSFPEKGQVCVTDLFFRSSVGIIIKRE